MDIFKYFTGQKLNDENGVTLLQITKITDGTKKTTFGGHEYLLYNPKTEQVCRDVGGKAFVKITMAYLNGPEYPPNSDKVDGRKFPGAIGQDRETKLEWRLQRTLPDETNKRVWWVKNPRYEYEISQDLKDEKNMPVKIERLVGGEHFVGTYDEFAAAVAEVDKIIADQKAVKKAEALEQTTIAAKIIADKAIAAVQEPAPTPKGKK